MKKSLWQISEKEKILILSFLEKGKIAEKTNADFAIISFDELYKLFTSEEANVFKKYLAFDSSTISKELPYLGTVELKDLASIKGQKFVKESVEHTLPAQYLPRKYFDAFNRLNEGIIRELDKRLLVLYGYRSPARQVFLFFDHLDRTFHFDFDETIKRIFPPEYSEHASGVEQGIDFITQEGVKGNGFEDTQEYVWLKKNATRFDFVESYARNNKFGVVWEPWHWRYIGD